LALGIVVGLSGGVCCILFITFGWVFGTKLPIYKKGIKMGINGTIISM